MTAHAACQQHEAAVLYDFLTRAHCHPQTLEPHDRLLMVVGFMRDRTSRVCAALQGWRYAPSEAEFVAYWQRDSLLWDHTAEKDRAQFKPLPRPWEPAVKAPEITDEVRAAVQRHRQRVRETNT